MVVFQDKSLSLRLLNQILINLKTSPLMSTKISNLSELSSVLSKKDKTESGILHFSKQFKVGHLLMSYAYLKKQGYSFIAVIIQLILIRLSGLSISSEMNICSKTMDDNTLYRLLNDARVNWRNILMSFACQYLRIVASHTEEESKADRCFVVDDTLIEKTGKTFSGLSKVFDHVKQRYMYGFKMLVLGYFDGKMLVPCCTSLHSESKDNNHGLNAKEQKCQHKMQNRKDSPGEERYQELDKKKTDIFIQMLKYAVGKGLCASYVLMDSWFTNDEVLKSIRKIKRGMLHVVGMCKMDRRKFTVEEKEYNSQTLININEKKGKVHNNKKYKSQYIVIDATYKGTPVRLFYVKYKKAVNWTLLLTTDTTINFNRIMEIYQIRWTIEVLFYENKQYLRLGKSQNVDFNGQIADATLALITYIILSLEKRFRSYETLGQLFRKNKVDMLEATLVERIMETILDIIIVLLDFLAIDIDETLKRIAGIEKEAQNLFVLLNAVNERLTGDLTYKLPA